MTSQSTTTSAPLFFWREFEEPYGFLSQWYDSPFEGEGVTYASTGIPSGRYQLQVSVNPARVFEEISFDNNVTTIPIDIP